MVFQDRTEAGIALAEELAKRNLKDPVVYALPRGGVPVAFPVSEKLNVTLDVIIVRKLGVPSNPEFAFGAIAPEEVALVDSFIVDRLGLSEEMIGRVIASESEEMERRINTYRGSLLYPILKGKTAIVIDDGVATGSTAIAAIHFLRKKNPAKIIFATPVCAADSAQRIGEEVNEVISLIIPENFGAVGMWYHEFGQTTDEEVMDFLSLAKGRREG